jgi:thioester reductase-like protein
MSDTILLTGATGHVGSALLPRLLADPDARVLALVRAKNAEHLAKRRADLLAVMPEGFPADRFEVVAGDVSAPGLGMSAADAERVASDVRSVIHSAASVRFDMPEDKADKENMASTAEILGLCRSLAERGRLVRYDHVSTCYVAGDRTGRVLEGECDEGQGFRNSYEWSKCQSEKKVRAAIAEGLPAAIHRPSIIVGDSSTGETRAFNVLYWPLRLYAGGWWRVFPGRPDALVDVVPVDFVADAIRDLRRNSETIGRCFHLAAGDDAAKVADLADEMGRILGRPPLTYVDQRVWVKWVRPVVSRMMSVTKRGRAIARGGKVFLPYFVANPLFDTTNARQALGRGAPPVKEYIGRIVRFAVEKNFGAT